MSLAIGVVSSSGNIITAAAANIMGDEAKNEENSPNSTTTPTKEVGVTTTKDTKEEGVTTTEERNGVGVVDTAAAAAVGDEKIKRRNMSEDSLMTTTTIANDEEEEDVEGKIDLGPQCSLKEQLEKDKDDESLRKWKEQLLGSVDLNSIGETLEPEVKITSLAIKSPGRSDIVLQIPVNGKVKGNWFTLKEGSRYSLQFTFQVNNNIVSGLKYTNTVWKTGVKVDSTKEMLGTFSPQAEVYTYEMVEDTTPSGIFARGSYTARTKFVDDDNKCYLEINYTFDIRKDW